MRGGDGRLAAPWKEGPGTHGSRTRATQASPPTSSATPAPTGTKALPKSHDKKPTSERGWMWGGDACVAHEGSRRLGTGTRATQASPPTSSATPAPTGTKALPKRHEDRKSAV